MYTYGNRSVWSWCCRLHVNYFDSRLAHLSRTILQKLNNLSTMMLGVSLNYIFSYRRIWTKAVQVLIDNLEQWS